ncbi:MAG: hypothetical protein ABR588_05915 [Sphingomicrobium sp.]|nr:hypothetical protein [Sphingomonadales bacterium]
MNRREVLAGIGIAGAVAVVPLSGALAATGGIDRAEWDAAMASLKQCEQAFNVSNEKADGYAQAYEEARPKLEMIDFREFPFTDRNEVARTYDIDHHERQRLAGEGTTWWAKDPEATRAKIKAACESVREFRRLEADAAEHTGYKAFFEQHEALLGRLCEAQTVLVEMPAPDAEALLWKINHLFQQEDVTWTPEYTAQFHSDAARLLSNGRA